MLGSDWQPEHLSDSPELYKKAAYVALDNKFGFAERTVDRLQRVLNRGKANEEPAVDLPKVNLIKPTKKEAAAWVTETEKVENAIKDHFDSKEAEKLANELAQEEKTGRYDPEKLAADIKRQKEERERQVKPTKGGSILSKLSPEERAKYETQAASHKLTSVERAELVVKKKILSAKTKPADQAENPGLKDIWKNEEGSVNLDAFVKNFKIKGFTAQKTIEKYLGVPFTDMGRNFATHVTAAVTHINKKTAEAVKMLDEGWQLWNWKATKDDALTYLMALEKTKAVDSDGKLNKADFKDELINAGLKPEQVDWMADQAQMHRNIMRDLFLEEKAHGSKKEWVENYVSHIFQDRKINGLTPQEFIQARLDKLGKDWYDKERSFDSIKAALDAGYKLQFDNPIDIVSARMAASINSNTLVDVLHRLKQDGLATRTVDATTGQKAMWTAYRTPYAQEWLIHPSGQWIWNNAMVAKSISARGDGLVSAYRTWMKLKNVWIPIQLAFSAFHEMHIVGNILPAQNLSRAINLSMHEGNWVKNLLDAGKLTAEQALFSLPLDKLGRGWGRALDEKVGGRFSKMRESQSMWDKTPEQQTPLERMWTQFHEWGGVIPNQSAEEVIGAKRALDRALGQKEYVNAVPAGIRRGIEMSQAWMFKYQIPALKSASFMRDVAAAFKIDPSLANDPIRARAVVQEIGKNINDRFGEMFYKGLFWNRYLKDTGIASLLSLSWQLGQIRQFGGALQNLATKSKLAQAVGMKPSRLQQTIYKGTDKGTFVASYIGLSMATAGAISWALSGKTPTGLDYVYPRNGEEDIHGKPQRLQTPFFTREPSMLMGHTEEGGGGLAGLIHGIGAYLYNKTILQPLVEQWTGHNYYGQELYDATAPWYKQALQRVDSMLGDHLDPIGISGAKRSAEKGGGAKGAALSLAGFGPAPQYLNNSPFENEVNNLYYHYNPPKSYEYGKETGLGHGLVQSNLRGAGLPGKAAYDLQGKAPDYTKSEWRQDANSRLIAAIKSGDQEAKMQAQRDLIDPKRGGMGVKSVVAREKEENPSPYRYSRLPENVQKALIQKMSDDEYNQYVRLNTGITAYKIKKALMDERERVKGPSTGGQ